VLLFNAVWHDDQEEIQVLGLLWLLQLLSVRVLSADVLQIVVIDSLLEGFDA